MEQIRNIFDRTRLCEGLRIPRTIGVFNYNRGDVERSLVERICTFMERSGVQKIYSRINYRTYINPFARGINIEDSVLGGLTRQVDMMRADPPEAAIWLGVESTLSNLSRVNAGLSEKDMINIYVSSNFIGIYYGKPLATQSSVLLKFFNTTDREFGRITSSVDGRSTDNSWYLKLAILVTYFAVSEQIHDMLTEKPEQAYLFNVGDFHEDF